jgi:hypothetical protein
MARSRFRGLSPEAAERLAARTPRDRDAGGGIVAALTLAANTPVICDRCRQELPGPQVAADMP